MAFQAGTTGRKVGAKCSGQLMQPAVRGLGREGGSEGGGGDLGQGGMWALSGSVACIRQQVMTVHSGQGRAGQA